MWLQTEQIAAAGGTGTVYFRVQQGWQPDFCHVRSVCVRLIRIKRRFVLFIVWQEKERTEFAQCQKGDKLEILGPLGNGFPMERAEGKKVFLIGGGIGIPPMVELVQAASG